MLKLLHFYQYTFYWAYAWSLRRFGVAQGPELNGLAAVSSPLLMNLFTILDLYTWVFHVDLLLPKLSSIVLWPLAALFLLPPYWYLIRNGRAQAIAAEFDAWDADRRWYMNRRVIFYLLGSVIAWAVAMYLDSTFPNPLHLNN